MSSDSIFQRRNQIRVYSDFQVYVHGKTAMGKDFKIHTRIDDISYGGIYLRLPYKQFVGSKLFTFVKVPSGARIASFGRIFIDCTYELNVSYLTF